MKVKDIISESILCEGLSPVLYHITSFKSAIGILRDNTIRVDRLSPEDREKENAKIAARGVTPPTFERGYVSFTRSLNGSYHKVNKLIGVIFEIDGRLLGGKYKGNPVGTETPADWYDPEDDGPAAIKPDEHGEETAYTGKRNGQLEDRVHTGPKGITDFTRYVTSAIVYVPQEYMDANDSDEFGDDSYHEQLKYMDAAIKGLNAAGISFKVIKSEQGLAGASVRKRREK